MSEDTMIVERTCWSSYVNVFVVKCTCGHGFNHPSNDSVMTCDKCGNMCFNEHSLWEAYGKDRGIAMARFLELESAQIK